MPEIALPTTPETNPGQIPPRSFSLRTLLRDATSADHARLDARLGEFDLHSQVGYRRFLEINAAALLPLEAALVAGGVKRLLPDWDERARTAAIRADLAAMDGAASPLHQPVLNGRFALLGTLYVLEGSRLGAAYLLKQVRQAADPAIAEATGFLAHGAGRKLWPSFLAVLESHAGDLTDEDDIVGPARGAFDLFMTAATQP
jgi:heme oxygenase